MEYDKHTVALAKIKQLEMFMVTEQCTTNLDAKESAMQTADQLQCKPE